MNLLDTILDPLILPDREDELIRLAMASMEDGETDERIGARLRKMQAGRISKRLTTLTGIIAMATGQAEVAAVAAVVQGHAGLMRQALREMLSREVERLVGEARKRYAAGTRVAEDDDEAPESLAERAVRNAQALRLEGARLGRISPGGPRGRPGRPNES